MYDAARESLGWIRNSMNTKALLRKLQLQGLSEVQLRMARNGKAKTGLP